MLKQRRIAIIVETSKGHGRGILGGIGSYARQNISWALHTEERGLTDPIPSWFNVEDFEGVLLRCANPADIRAFADMRIPTVYLGSDHQYDVLTVCPDQTRVAAVAAEHLLEQGFTRFAYVGIDGYPWADGRRDAFATYLAEAGFECEVFSPAARADSRPDWSEIQRQLEIWLPGISRPIGIMCANDAMGRALLNVCRRVELTVPEEIAVVGVDNDELICEFNDPTLTSVDMNTHQIGFAAAEILDRLIDGASDVASLHISPIGVRKRRSTDIIAIEDSRIAAALGFIRRYACEGINVEDVLSSVLVSRSTLERAFKEVVRRTPLEEIQRVRLVRAKRLLEETNLKLDAISRQCGFAHTPHMIQHFRRQFGASPGQYRKNIRSSPTEAMD